MFLKSFLFAAALVRSALAYEVTSYYYIVVTTLTNTYGGEAETDVYTNRGVFVQPPTEEVSIITASTTTGYPDFDEGPKMTFVSALVSLASSPTPTSFSSSYYTYYYVPVTYECGGQSRVVDATVSVPFEVEDLPTTSATTSTYDPTRSLQPVVYEWVDPSEINSVDLAAASFSAQPDDCVAATATVDYREACANPSQGTGGGFIVTYTPDFECGELNPCCHGCEGYGYKDSDDYSIFGGTVEFYLCHDGRAFDLNGTEIENPKNGASKNGAGAGMMAILLSVTVMIVLAIG